MDKKNFRISLAIMTVIIGALVFLNVRQAQSHDWDVCYEMANRNIQWSGAGYNGVYGK